MVRIIKHKEAEEFTVDVDGTVLRVLEHLGVNPETVIVSVNGVIVGDDFIVRNDDVVALHSVLSGG